MSHCNYCLIEAMRKHASKIGQRVTVKPVLRPAGENMDIPWGLDVFLHPPHVKDEELEARYFRDEPPKYFAAWIAALPDHCVCGEP